MISVVGIGPGDSQYLTAAAKTLIDDADYLAGWPRALSAFAGVHAQMRPIGSDLDALIAWLDTVRSHKVVVLASGDPLLFGIGKRIAESLAPASWQIVPGISSVQFLFSRIGLDMNDLYVTSSHGKQPDFDFLFSMPKVAMVTDQLIGPRQIADALQARGLSRTLYIGENLSYPDERIHCLRPADVAPQYAMNVVVILDEGQ